MKKLLWLFCSMLLLIGMAGQAGAALLTFNFSGHLIDDGGISELASNTFTGSFTYDTSATNVSPNPTTFGTYNYDPSGLNGISVLFSSGVTFETDPTKLVGVSIQNASTDKFDILSNDFYQSGISSVSFNEESIYVGLLDSTGLVLPNTNLPTSFDLSAWNVHMLFTRFVDPSTGGYVYVDGEIDTLSASPVPEPATLLLLSSGLLGLAGFSRKKFFKK